MLHIGVVGPGSIADRRLAPALQQLRGATLWSVCSRDPERARIFAARHGARGPIFGDLADMLADPRLDAVVIATPDRLHAAQAIAAAAAGKHVFVEKPMATSVADAEAVVRACEAAGVRLAVGYHLRFHPGLRALRARVLAGELGRVLHMRATWTFVERDAGNWRASPEVGRWWSLAAVGTHCLDLVRWFLRPACGEIEHARALTSSPVHRSPHDETAAVALRFASGATADILTSVVFRAPRTIEVFGDAGSARGDEVLGPHGGGRIVVGDRELSYEPADPYLGELQDFVDAVAHGRAPEVDAVEGLANVRGLCEMTEA
ncbi:Gfo/Idh/MocA family protein [Nannocystis bainbridge]|uniref:Gfo/Idh/MocA family oxidoreductase n=1 Tax=Nannocystis bainbridge TaxID=2995303 RepID=A0ABT5E0P2_9BACT|nr:Gfo/Idh/MocA family oxidoreductase [Nannocystis bainbridge]MDC0719442.1 Gfo/Idh/MocA family oxidoreductase [Nannocystis bainbridge]